MNSYTDTVAAPLSVLRISGEVEHEQVRRLAQRREDRDQRAVDISLADLRDAAAGEGNLVPLMLDAARAEATVGEICESLRKVFGSYSEPPNF